MRFLRISLVAALLAVLHVGLVCSAAPARNVVVVTIDGFRWQEVFGGADREYFKKTSDGKPSAAERRFWRDEERVRRETLLPFLWTTIAKDATTSQLAATVAALLGEDYGAAFPAAAPPLPIDK